MKGALIAATAAAVALSFAGPANAAVIQTWTLPSEELYFDLFPYSFGSVAGKYKVSLHSTRALTYGAASVSEFVDWRLNPVSGPGPGASERWYEGNELAYDSTPYSIAITFQSTGNTEEYGCCWPSGGELVPYREQYFRDTQLHASFEFAAGTDPITVTLSLSAIPEPATWAMTILGFGLIGTAVRRSRAKGQPTA
jgi:hypothetical protein